MSAERKQQRVVVVGPCGAGKSTVVEQLRRWGYDAFTVSQEHSIVPDLWRRRAPDALIYLHVEYPVLQARRGAAWPHALYERQMERLEDARRHATLVIDTGAAGINETMARVVAALEQSAARDS